LAEQPGSSKTVIELIENFGLVEYAICLLTADDLGGVKGADLKPRARQNVILEVGYFFALLGRNRVSVVADASLELPSDVVGLRPIILGPGTNLEKRLADDMIHAGVLSESSA
jgi:predicted nucleotide-binding protein